MTLQRLSIQMVAALVVFGMAGPQSEASSSQSAKDVPVDESPKQLKAKCLELILTWVRANKGALPKATDFGFELGQIPIKYDYLTSVGHHGPKGTAKPGVYPSIQHVWIDFKAYTESRGFAVRLMSLQFRVPLLPEMRAIFQQEANEQVLQWVIENKGRAPEDKNFGMNARQIPITYERLMGRGVYSPGERSAGSALFASPQEFWLQSQKYAQSQGVGISLLQVTFKDALSDELRAHQQSEALALTLAWAQRNGGLCPTSSDFGFGENQIPIYYERLISIGSYGPNRRAHAAIFASGAEFWRRFEDYAREQGLVLRQKGIVKPEKPAPVQTQKKPGPVKQKPEAKQKPKVEPIKPVLKLVPAQSALKEVWTPKDQLRAQVGQLILDWNQKIGMRRFPKSEHFGPGTDQIAFSYEQLVSQGSFAKGQPLEHEGLFENEQEFGLWLKEYADQQGVKFKLIHMPFAGERSEKIQMAIQQEALSLILDWMQAHGKKESFVPAAPDFTSHGGPIKLNYNRLTGTGLYFNHPRSQSRIFGSVQEFETALKKAAASLLRASSEDCDNMFRTQLND